MYRIKDDPENLYRSPSQILKYFELLKQTIGISSVLKRSEFQKDREAWIASVFIIGYSLIKKGPYWLKIISSSESPDILSINFKKIIKNGKTGRVKLEMRLEITEFEENNNMNIEALIKNKLKNYSSDTRLIIYVHGRAGEAIDLNELFEKVKQMTPKIAEIWLLGSVKSSNSKLYALTQLHPYKNQKFFDYVKEANKNRQAKVMSDLGRGFQSKFEKNLGEIIIFKGKLKNTNI